MANPTPGKILLDKINNIDQQILLKGLPYETFIQDIKDVRASITPNPTYKDIFEDFIKKLNEEAEEDIFKIETTDAKWTAVINNDDEVSFRAYYATTKHAIIKRYFTMKIMKTLFTDIFKVKNEIQKFNKDKEKKEVNLLNTVFSQPDFTINKDDAKIRAGIENILQDPKTPETLKEEVLKSIPTTVANRNDIINDYTLLNDKKTDFNTTSSLINDFVIKCIKDAKSEDCLPHVGNMLNIDYGKVIDYFESQIKQLPRDKLLQIAKGLDIRIYSPTGLFENEKLWERHTNFLKIDFTNANNSVEGLLKNVFETYRVEDDDSTDMAKLKGLIATNKEKFDKIMNKKHERITTVKGYILGFVKVVSHELNEKKFEIEEKDEKDRPNSRFNKDVVQYRILNNSIFYPTNPLYWIPTSLSGGKFELKPNKNQTADILEKMIKALLESLSAHNKYLNPDDIQLIYAAIDKLRKFETYLGELLVEASNYAENIQKEKDMTQQYITIDKIKDNNKKINETTTKIVTLKQKIDYLVNTLYTQKKEEENKTKQLENKENKEEIGITIKV